MVSLVDFSLFFFLLVLHLLIFFFFFFLFFMIYEVSGFHRKKALEFRNNKRKLLLEPGNEASGEAQW